MSMETVLWRSAPVARRAARADPCPAATGHDVGRGALLSRPTHRPGRRRRRRDDHRDARPAAAPGRVARDRRCSTTSATGSASAPCRSASPPGWPSAPGLPVVSDLRARGVAAGGHGAPLASTLDALWLAGPGGPRAALDLGGIAKVTIVGDEGEPVLAWDTGPANCLLDVAAARVTDGRQTRDDDGRLAGAGTVVTTCSTCCSSTHTSAWRRRSPRAARRSRRATSTTCSTVTASCPAPTCSPR